MVVSVGAATITSAGAAELPSTGDKVTDFVLSKGYEKGKDAIKENVPGGSVIAGAIEGIVGCFSEKELTLTDINNHINALRGEINTQFAEVKNEIKNCSKEIEGKIVDQTVIAGKGQDVDTLMSGLKTTEFQFKAIENSTAINDNEKAVEMAYLIGDNSQWSSNSANLIYQYQSFIDTLSSSSFADQTDRDFCQVIYNDCRNQVMFSGEAVDRANQYIARVLYLGLYAYSIESQCLKAAQVISKFGPEEEATLNKDELIKYQARKALTDNVNVVINEMNDRMFNGEREDSVVKHISDFQNTERLIYLNKGASNRQCKAQLITLDPKAYSGATAANDAMTNSVLNNTFTESEFNALRDYIGKEYGDISMKDFLQKVGFDVTPLGWGRFLGYKGANYVIHFNRRNKKANILFCWCVDTGDKARKEQSYKLGTYGNGFDYLVDTRTISAIQFA